MPTGITGGRLTAYGVALGLVLALAVFGCGTDGNTDDTAQPNRGHSDMRDAGMVPNDPALAPEEVPTPPVPQDPQAQTAARKARLARLTEYYTTTHARHGRHEFRWNGPAAQAVRLWATIQAGGWTSGGLDCWELTQSFLSREERYEGQADERSSDEQIQAWESARKAVDAGCTDPFVLSILARLSYGEREIDFGRRVRYWTAAAAGMRGSAYPALFRAETFAQAGACIGREAYTTPAQLPEAQALLEEALALLPAVARETRNNPDERYAAYHLGRILVDAFRKLPERRSPALDFAYAKVDAVMRVNGVNPVDRQLLAANTYIRRACLSRGRQPADHVSADGWTDFDANLSQAADALSLARTLEPDCVEVPRLMLLVECGQDRGRDRMEVWFERAMRLNGDDYYACLAKLQYLSPIWHGGESEMLSFGRACLRTKNWEGRLPFILADAHCLLNRDSLPQGAHPETAYYSRDYVWNDIQAVYEPYLARHPDSHFDKSVYARLAALGGHWDRSKQLFNELGNGWWRSVFPGDEYVRHSGRARRGGMGWHPVPGGPTRMERPRPLNDLGPIIHQ